MPDGTPHWDLRPFFGTEKSVLVQSMRRIPVILGGLAIAALSLSLVSCTDSDDGEDQGATSSSRETSATSAVAKPTVADLELVIAAEFEAKNPDIGPGVVECDASGELADWQPVLCRYLPDEPSETGAMHVSMLDEGRFAWAPGECCDAAPWPDAYPSGLLCHELTERPPGIRPGHYLPESDHLSYGLAVFYWLTENRPDRMDDDLNGRPCESVYPPDEVAAFWDSARTL